MRFGELVFVGVAMDGYSLYSIHAHELGEAFNWDFGCACDKLHQFSKALLAVLLHHFPEPDNDLITWVVARVVSVFLQVLDVHFGHSGHQKLELLCLEEGNALLGDNLVEPL